MKYTTLFPVLVLTSMFLSFSFYWKFGKGHLRVNSTEQKQNKETPLATSQTRLMKTEKQVNEIFKRIDQLVPKLTFTHMDNTTSARTSKATVLNPKDKYCIGDLLIVRLDMYDYLGNRKKCGGDFLRARIYSPELQAAFSGRIEDLNNGSYLVHFTLSWEGRIRFSFLLFHPSEGVSALWRARNEGYNNVEFTGTFTNATYTATTQCNFNLRTDQEVCEYLETRDEDYFYCVKPLDLPCGSLTSLQSHNTDHSYLSALEKSLIARSNIGIEIPRPFPYIDVFLCGTLKYFDLHRTGLESKLLAMDMDSNLLIQWKKHGHPYIAHKGYTVKDNVYVSREIDLLDGGKYTVIVISLGQHFRPFPIYMFVKRMLGIRKAIERLFMRSPDTKVIIKSENTREMTIDMERFSDFHGYIQYLVVKEIFHDLNIGVVDAWDISTAYASNNVHPHDDVVRSQVYMFLSYIC
ncbi:NXPE family member 1 isoform X2 [Microcaecilia unicolor]|uniref:NXPE family member 1-like isoform X2 n=1 Tax=Microcaecilia unicolor TaxID=1415580 RepID=A0A6P7ZBR5_9AMPH|nr:NXPE family member 1-like isoform X2 [Microcaecilia unicolor]